eukprot:6486981-Amphidinium_carterae.1
MIKTVWLRKFYFTVIGIGWIDFTRTSQCTSPTPRTGTALPGNKAELKYTVDRARSHERRDWERLYWCVLCESLDNSSQWCNITAEPVCCYRSLQAPMALYSLEFRFVGEVLAPAQMWTSASWVTGPATMVDN